MEGGSKLDMEKKTQPIGKTLPIAIEDVRFESRGPVVVEKRWAWDTFSRSKWIGRGFIFSFSLIDVSNQRTISDGRLYIALVSDKMGWSGRETLSFSIGRADIREAERMATFFRKIDVSKGDFKLEEKSEELRYTYVHLDPPVFFQSPFYDRVFLHLWFDVPNGNLLYNKKMTRWD